MEDQDRKALIDYRIRQAEGTVELAGFLIENGRLAVAINRVYYGMYYALSALALKHGFATSKHRQLIGWFNKEFVASGKLDIRFGKSLRNAFRNRTKGDYDAFVEFSREEAAQLLDEMSDFVQEIKRLLRE